VARKPKPAAAEVARPKGERTKAHILATALALFRERGYEATGMRAIAEQAGVSIGNAYHYFESKEHLVQAFYAETHRLHLEACVPALAGVKPLGARLAVLLTTKIDTAEPYHHLSAILFRTAADPKSPLNPFSAASTPVREDATQLMKLVIEGSDARVPADLASELPNLLWLFEMSVILFWIHDDSAGRARTRLLIARSSELLAKLVSLASFPLVKGMRTEMLELVRELRAGAESSAPGTPSAPS